MACGDKGTDPIDNTSGQTGATGSTGSTGATGSTGGSTTNSISVVDYSFSPTSTTVAVGTTVTWNVSGYGPHNVTFDNAGVSGSGDMTSGASFSKQFGTAGTYTYHCTNHYGMTGTVTVQ